MSYGMELVLDLHDCDVRLFNREDITAWYTDVMEMANVEPGPLHFWDFEGFWINLWWKWFDPKELKKNAPSYLKGTSAVQFIKTSSITIHALDDLESLYVNFFSCDDFIAKDIVEYTEAYFGGKVVSKQVIRRK